MVMYWQGVVGVSLSINVVAIVTKFVWVVAHPIVAHSVDGCGRRETGQVDFAVKECHHVRYVTVRNRISDGYYSNTCTLLLHDMYITLLYCTKNAVELLI